jgi:hypothetical protein
MRRFSFCILQLQIIALPLINSPDRNGTKYSGEREEALIIALQLRFSSLANSQII